MKILRNKTTFDFVGARWKFFAASGLLMGITVVSLLTKGLIFGIDFTGGTVLQFALTNTVSLAEVRSALEANGVPDASLQSFKGSNSFSARIKSESALTAADIEKIVSGLQKTFQDNALIVERQEYVGPTVGSQLFRQAIWAILFSLSGIVVYVAFRFTNPIWGIAGVVALGHDVFLTLGLFSLFGSEVDLLIVSALLTIAGFSINDTIVIFDRMREKMHLMRHDPLDIVINDSINETMSRTLITNGTVFTVVTILFLFGGKVIHNFAMAMVFGSVVGTYSTIAIAAPMVYQWHVRGRKTSAYKPAGAKTSSRAQNPAAGANS